jgi:dipeptidyl aminopeptidase/acylaminoacyl peptidase
LNNTPLMKTTLAVLTMVSLNAQVFAASITPSDRAFLETPPILGFKEIIETREISEETLSPDGRFAAYVVTIPEVKSNARRAELQLASADGRSIRLIPTPPASRPSSIQWFPDGRRFAFLLRSGGTAQIHICETETGEARAITHSAEGVDRYALRPDGRYLAWISSASSGKRIWAMDAAENTEPIAVTEFRAELTAPSWHPDGRRIFFLWSEAAPKSTPSAVRWLDEPRPAQRIGSVDFKTRQERVWLPDAGFTVLNYKISPGGKHLAFQAFPSLQGEDPNDPEPAALRLMNLENENVQVLLPKNGGPDNSFYAFSPDGRKLAFVAPDRLQFRRNGKPRLLDLETGRQRAWLETDDIDVGNIFWNESSDMLFFSSSVRTNRPWFSLRLSDGALARISPDSGYQEGRYVPEARAFLFSHSDAAHPAELFKASLSTLSDRGRWVQISRANVHLLAWPMSSAQTVRWKGRDGREIEGLLYTPPGYKPGRPRPMIVQCYAGTNRFASSFVSYAQALAARGYLVFQPNPRGYGSFYGEKFMFEGFSPANPLDAKFQDFVSGVEHLCATGVADRERLGLMGWSWGGNLADWIMVNTSIFKAVSSGAGWIDQVAIYGQGDYQKFYRLSWGNSAFSAWEDYMNHSPVRFIGRAKTPTLLNVGENDAFHVGQCRATYNALREFGVPAEMLIHAGQSHMLQSPQSLLAKILAEFFWFEQWVNGGPSWLNWREEYNRLIAQ